MNASTPRALEVPLAPPAWDDEPCDSYPALHGEVTADACVVGLGGSGLSCVLELLAMGKRVVALDAGPVGCGAAGRNGGFLLAGLADFHHDAVQRLGRERARGLYLHTVAGIERMAAETPDLVHLTGSLRIASNAEELEDCERQFQQMHDDALPVSRYTGPEGRGLLIPTDGSFHPLRRCRTLAQRCASRGASLFERSRATSVEAGSVETPEGRVRCERVIVAVDGRLDRIFPELSPRVRTARLQMIGTAPTDEIRLTRPVYSRWGYDYWQQLPDRRLVLGGFRDRHEHSEWTSDAEPSDLLQRLLEQHLRRELRVRAPITHRWAASVGFTDTGIPILEQVRGGVWALGGYSGTGNVVGALCGRAAARLAFGQRDEFAELLAS